MMGWTGASADALPAAGPIDLKLGNCLEEFDSSAFAATLSPVASQDLDPVAQALQANLDQRYTDQAVINALAESGFAGPLYGKFEHELAAYATNVIPSWVKSGKIWVHCRKTGFGLLVTDADRRALEADHWQAAHDLANSTVVVTLHKFRQLALIERRWTPDGGATLTTYFMGLVAYTFPNEYRHWCAGRGEMPLLDGDLLWLDREHEGANPADQLEVKSRINDTLAAFPTTSAQIVFLADAGFDQNEIADLLRLPSARAVEGYLYRLRKDPATRGKVRHHA